MSTRKGRKAQTGVPSDEQGHTIRERLALLRKMAPKKDGLHLYRTLEQRKRATDSATLFVYIRSDENAYALHETFFKKRKPMTPLEWEHYFKTVVLHGTGDNEDEPALREGVLAGAVLPGVNIRTQKLWSARAVIGFITHDIHNAARPAISTRRHQTKSSRLKN